MSPMLRYHILDLLVDGPSSFAALYAALNRNYPSPTGRVSITEMWTTMHALEAAGWIAVRFMLAPGGFGAAAAIQRKEARDTYEGWLPNAPYDEMSVDEVGLWLELLQDGRAAWQTWAGSDETHPRWTLEQNGTTNTIIVHAADADTANSALSAWLHNNPGIALRDGAPSVQPVSSFRLRDGTIIPGGVRLTAEYQEEGSSRK